MIRIGNMIHNSRKPFEDWLKAEGLDDGMELDKELHRLLACDGL